MSVLEHKHTTEPAQKGGGYNSILVDSRKSNDKRQFLKQLLVKR